MHTPKTRFILILALLLLSGCANLSDINSLDERHTLTYADLMNGFEAASPVKESALTPPLEAVSAEHIFEGRLEIIVDSAEIQMEFLRGGLEAEYQSLPPFEIDFVQFEDHLVPVQRASVVADHPAWNYIIGPGRIWQETGDQGFSRASFPFALVVKGGNATFNGTMSFLYNEEQVSKVWFQITQETTTYTRANYWGLLEAAYHVESLENAGQVRAAFETELANRFPTKSLEALADDHPGIDLSAFGYGVTPEHLTWVGFVVDGTNYLGGCQTRYGSYPYCESMRVTSYSTAKSAFVSVALMRLAQVYGPEVADLLIKDHLPETAESPGDWESVTFNDTLDMATGNYRSASRMLDEDGERMNEFFGAQPYAERMAIALDWPNSNQPGQRWVYRTSDTFILTRAMQNYLQSQRGPDADIFDFVVEEVYRPLGMGPGVMSTMRTADDDWQGQAEGGYGIWWTPDDIAKISTLLQNGGQFEGEQLLHPRLLAAALQQDPDQRGVRISGFGMYKNAFWGDQYPENRFGCEVWIPTMQGVSGNVVALMPNGSTYYYFSDNKEFTWDVAVRESNKIKAFCE